jgi:hypothetical protein
LTPRRYLLERQFVRATRVVAAKPNKIRSQVTPSIVQREIECDISGERVSAGSVPRDCPSGGRIPAFRSSRVRDDELLHIGIEGGGSIPLNALPEAVGSKLTPFEQIAEFRVDTLVVLFGKNVDPVVHRVENVLVRSIFRDEHHVLIRAVACSD